MDTATWTQGFRLGGRQLWRDLRAGQLRLLMLSIALAVAALSAVGFLADRLQTGLWRDAAQLLGGDVVVVSDKPTPQAFEAQAQQQGLQTNTSLSFPTMARAPAELGGASRLVALKAVASGYPLRGQLKVQRSAEAGNAPVPHMSSGKVVPGDPNSPQRGSLELANMSMETFQQGDSSYVPNCFGCHNFDTAKPLNVSHICTSLFASDDSGKNCVIPPPTTATAAAPAKP